MIRAEGPIDPRLLSHTWKVPMSWDVILLRVPADVASMDEIGDDCTPIGRRQDVLAAISQAMPEADLPEPEEWGRLIGPTWSMELDIGSEDPTGSIMLHIRGSGDDVLTPVFHLAAALECKVLDCSDGDVITPEGPSGWHAFQEFRDRVIDSTG